MRTKTVFVLFEQDEGTQEMMCAGVYTSKKLAQQAHDRFEELYPPHWPTDWRIEEHEIDNFHSHLNNLESA